MDTIKAYEYDLAPGIDNNTGLYCSNNSLYMNKTFKLFKIGRNNVVGRT